MAHEYTGRVKQGMIYFSDFHNGGAVTPVSTGAFRVAGHSRERTWSTQKKPWNKTLPYTDERFSFSQKEFDVAAYLPGSPEVIVHHMWGRGDLFYGIRDYCRGIASSKLWLDDGTALDRALQKTSRKQWDLAVDLAEGKDTLRMVGAMVSDITRVARAAKGKGIEDIIRNPPAIVKGFKNLVNPSKETVKDISGRWLQYHLGLTPVVNSIQDAVKMMTSEVGILSVHEKSRGGGFSSDSSRFSYNSSSLATSGWSSTGVMDLQWSSHTRRFFTYKRKPEAYSPAKELGFDSLARVGWELFPLSFTINWALDIGGWLENLHLASDLEVVDSGRGCVVEVLLNATPNFQSGGAMIPLVLENGGYTAHYRKYVRESNASISPSLPVLTNPFQGKSAAFRSLTAAALAAQRILT